MSDAAIGARVMYCGHNGWFVADIFRVGNVNVVKASGSINPSVLVRDRNEEATHIVSDFPKSGCWCPERGVLVVPEDQVKTLPINRLVPENHIQLPLKKRRRST